MCVTRRGKAFYTATRHRDKGLSLTFVITVATKHKTIKMPQKTTVHVCHVVTIVFILQVKTAETRSVRHFHFTAWPDHGVPETTELLIGFRHLVREHMDQYSKHSPTVVHCRCDETHTLLSLQITLFKTAFRHIQHEAYKFSHSWFLSVLFTQCWGWTHGHLHSH